MRRVRVWLEHEEYATVGMPRIGCGLAGGDWAVVEKILNRIFGPRLIYVYDFNPREG